MPADQPVNSNLSAFEFICRNIYETSQYSGGRLKKNRFYPNYRRESRSFPGRHTSRISVQRLCLAGFEKALYWASQTKSKTQTLIGLEMAPASVALNQDFELEPFASPLNPFHAHIVIKELDLPYPQKDEFIDSIMNPGIRHRIDNMVKSFVFYDCSIPTASILPNASQSCIDCLDRKNSGIGAEGVTS